VLLSIFLLLTGLRLLKFSWDIRRITPGSCRSLPIESLDRVTEILDRQVELLERLEREILAAVDKSIEAQG
jgi:hypothetical protein